MRGSWFALVGQLLTFRNANTEELAADEARAGELGERLARELARLDMRDYSQEGIPMFLACENLSIEDRNPGAVTRLPSNAALARSFRRYADELPNVRANVTEHDVAKLVELLADQDFAAGGNGGP
jgi:hypothetical protein